MGTHVYANGDEICCKSADGRTSVAFPDPCWTPPTPPAGPLLITYPNSAGPSSLKKGSSTVCIKRSAIALTDRSYFSTSTGDEPATPALQKGLLTRKIKGKAYFKQWSMNVKVEGKGVCRNIDLMTHNHGSVPGNTATFPFLDGASRGDSKGEPCRNEKARVQKKCSTEGLEKKQDWTDKYCDNKLLQIKPNTEELFNQNGEKNPRSSVLSLALNDIKWDGEKYGSLDEFADAQAEAAMADDCLKAKKCELVPYSKATKRKDRKGHPKGCCNGQTGHHVVPNSMAKEAGCSDFNADNAPCICVEGTSHHKGSHKQMHHKFADLIAEKLETKSKPLFSMPETINLAAGSVKEVFPDSGCSKACIQAQLASYYKDCKNKMGPVGSDAKPLDKSAITSIQNAKKAAANTSR